MKPFLKTRFLATGTIALIAVMAAATKADAQAVKKIAAWLTWQGANCAPPPGQIYGAVGSVNNCDPFGAFGSSPYSSGHTAWRAFGTSPPGCAPTTNNVGMAAFNNSNFAFISGPPLCSGTPKPFGTEVTCQFTANGCTWTAHALGIN